MEDILCDYEDFSSDPEFTCNIKSVCETLNNKLLKYSLFALLNYVFLVKIFNFYYFRYVQSQLFRGVLSVLYLIFPIIICIAYGKKLIILDKYTKKSNNSSFIKTVYVLLSNIFILILSFATLLFFTTLFNAIPITFFENLWKFYPLFIALLFFATLFSVFKLFTKGFSYFLVFSQTYATLYFFANLQIMCTFLSDLTNFNQLFLNVLLKYIFAISIAFTCFFVLKKASRGKI